MGKNVYYDHMKAYNERWFLLHHMYTENLELCVSMFLVYTQVMFKATTV